MHKMRLAAVALGAALACGTAQAQQQTCFPSKFGPKDQIGNANYITPEKTLQAVKTITRGKAYRLGIENFPAFATRGILLDMAGYLNTDIVKEGTAFNRAEIEGAMKRQGVKSIDKGDVVLFYTGWTKLIGKDNKRYGSAEPGVGVGGAKYLAEKGVAAVGADTWGVEVIPFEPNQGVFEVHQILLPMNGIYILENMDTGEMVQDRAWEFLFTLGPSRVTGAVQAIINPIAIK